MSFFNTMGSIAAGYNQGQQEHQIEQLNQARLQAMQMQNQLMQGRMQALHSVFGGGGQPAQVAPQQPPQQSPAQQPTQQWHPPLQIPNQQPTSAQSLLQPPTAAQPAQQQNPFFVQGTQLATSASKLATLGDLTDAQNYMKLATDFTKQGMSQQTEQLKNQATQTDLGLKEAAYVGQLAASSNNAQDFYSAVQQGMEQHIIDPAIGQKLLNTPWSPQEMQQLVARSTTRSQMLKAQQAQATLAQRTANDNAVRAQRQAYINFKERKANAKAAQEAKTAKAKGPNSNAPTASDLKAAGFALRQALPGADFGGVGSYGMATTLTGKNKEELTQLIASEAQDVLRTNPGMTVAQAAIVAAQKLRATGAISGTGANISISPNGETEYNPLPLTVKGGKPIVPKFTGVKFFLVPSKITTKSGHVIPAGSIIPLRGD